jgi:hypothetical protein
LATAAIGTEQEAEVVDDELDDAPTMSRIPRKFVAQAAAARRRSG